MDEDKIEEETYSLIFKTLKHPLRRKILRMLSEKPRGYSEMLEELAIDSGHLSYHIENLGDIITHTKNEKYALSPIGQAAVKLMNGVEEQHSATKTVKRARRISKTALIFSTIFAIALLTWTVYAVTFTTQQQITLFATAQFDKVPIILQPNQKQNYTISLKPAEIMGPGYSIDKETTTVFASPATNTATEWTRRFSDSLFHLNGTSDITITIYDYDNRILDQRREASAITNPAILTLNFELTEYGNYTLQFENLGGEEFQGTLVPKGIEVTYYKPLFSYGIMGIIILVLYPVLLFLSRKLIT